MMKLIKEVKPLIHNEYCRATLKFGPVNNSDYEGAAFLLECVENLHNNLASVADESHKFWKFVKTNASEAQKKQVLKSIQNDAILAACDAIQVATMAYRAELTIDTRGEKQ